MSYRVKITEAATGNSVVYESEGAYSDYSWGDGNYSCDCNRGLFFKRAEGVDEEEAWDSTEPCTKGKYAVEFMDGEVAQ